MKSTMCPMPLRVETMPCSWTSTSEGNPERTVTYGRRVWGERKGDRVWRLEARGTHLALVQCGTGHTAHRAYIPDGYDSPWHSDCVAACVRVAEWHEGEMFNGSESTRPEGSR